MVISPVWSGPNVLCNSEVKGAVHDPVETKHPHVCLTCRVGNFSSVKTELSDLVPHLE